MLTACLLPTSGRYVEQLEVGVVQEQIALATVELEVVNSDRPPGALTVRRFSAALDELGEEQVESWSQRPRTDFGDYPRGLQLGAFDTEPALVYERVAEIGYESDCGYCDFHMAGCLCELAEQEYCQAPVSFAAAASPRFYPQPLDSMPYWTTSLAMVSRGVSLVPGGQGLDVASWTERYRGGEVEVGGTICTIDDVIALHRFDQSSAALATVELLSYAPYQLSEVHGARLAEDPGVLALHHDGLLELLTLRAEGVTEQLLVPEPTALYHDGPRAYGPSTHASWAWAPGRFPRIAVAPLGSGSLVAAVTHADYADVYAAPSQGEGASESAGDREGCSYEECMAPEPQAEDRIAVFTVGCGVEVAPVQAVVVAP
jgi:hypothetical protein